MGNRIMRTVLFAASALLSVSAFGAGAARFGTLRNSDWVVTNAWQAVSNKTHDLILEIGQVDSLPPDWQNVSNAAMNAVQSLQPATNYTDVVAAEFEDGTRHVNYADSAFYADEAGQADYLYDPSLGQVSSSDLIRESTNSAVAVTDIKISTNNPAFVSAVLAAPLEGADPSDLSELAEYGSYGTVGAALLALIAGLAALKRRMTSAETAISGKVNATDLPYALVVPGEWEFSGAISAEDNPSLVFENGSWILYAGGISFPSGNTSISSMSVVVDTGGAFGIVTATRASLPAHLLDRANNLVTVTANTTLTLPPFVAGKVRDLLVRLDFGTIAEGASVPTIIFQGQGDEAPSETDAISFVTDDGSFPVPDSGGDWWYSLTECAPHVFAVSLKQLQSVSQPTQGGS